MDVPVSVPAPGKYRIAVKLHDIGQDAPVAVGFKGGPAKTLEKVTGHQSTLHLGTIEVGKARTFTLTAQSPAVFAVDYIRIDVEK